MKRKNRREMDGDKYRLSLVRNVFFFLLSFSLFLEKEYYRRNVNLLLQVALDDFFARRKRAKKIFMNTRQSGHRRQKEKN
jgi:hypothetical protein